jgi:hypothetical protein
MQLNSRGVPTAALNVSNDRFIPSCGRVPSTVIMPKYQQDLTQITRRED